MMQNAANWAIFSFLSGLWGGAHGSPAPPPLEPPMCTVAHCSRSIGLNILFLGTKASIGLSGGMLPGKMLKILLKVRHLET